MQMSVNGFTYKVEVNKKDDNTVISVTGGVFKAITQITIGRKPKQIVNYFISIKDVTSISDLGIADNAIKKIVAKVKKNGLMQMS